MAAFIRSKYSKNCNVMKLLHFEMYSCDQSWIFSVITSAFSVTWSFRIHSNMMICCCC